MYLVIIRQRIKYSQEIEFVFSTWEDAQSFVRTALYSGKNTVAEVMPLSPDDDEIPDIEDDTDFND